MRRAGQVSRLRHLQRGEGVGVLLTTAREQPNEVSRVVAWGVGWRES